MIYDKKKFYNFLTVVFCIILLIVLTVLCVQTVNEERVLDRVEDYEIQSGETLWSIASEYRPETMSIQEYIFNLQQYNNISAIIYPQQKIKVLIYKEA